MITSSLGYNHYFFENGGWGGVLLCEKVANSQYANMCLLRSGQYHSGHIEFLLSYLNGVVTYWRIDGPNMQYDQ